MNELVSRDQFPTDFTWGTATASYQIEGAAALDGRTPSIWDTFAHTPGKVFNGDTGDEACDHYHRYATDFDLMKNLGFNAYRFSTSWSRIIPNGRGAVNHKGLDFYDRLLDALLERQIMPYATLYHWDLPQTLEDKGGWASRDTAYAFAEYTDVLTQHLGDRLKNWITLNEPWCSAYLGYGIGIHAPGKTDFATSLQAAHHLLFAHGLAMPIIRSNVPNSNAGIVLNLVPTYAHNHSSQNEPAVQGMDGFFNRWYLEPIFGKGYPTDILEAYAAHAPRILDNDLQIIAAPLDFFGINYYSRSVVETIPSNPNSQNVGEILGFKQVNIPNVPRTSLNWEVYPQGLTDLLLRVQHDYNPKSLLVTENGATYQDQLEPDGSINDAARTAYFQSHIAACQTAITQGAKLSGYFAWSFLDNFEWAEGYDKRFGITYVDFKTQERTVKRSGQWFRQFLHKEDL